MNSKRTRRIKLLRIVKPILVLVRILGPIRARKMIWPVSPKRRNLTAATTRMNPLVYYKRQGPLLFRPNGGFVMIYTIVSPNLGSVFHPFCTNQLIRNGATTIAPNGIARLLRPIEINNRPKVIRLS